MGGLLTVPVVVLADDLMWSTRIVEAVRRAGGSAVPLTSDEELDVALEAYRLGDVNSISGAVVDLAARRFDGVAAIERVAAARLPVLAVAEHDDQLTRRRALKAGALRVFSYRKFFEDGTRLLEGWLAANAAGGAALEGE
jgi:DNA-binding NarL/FixJ family response regulator